MITRTVGGTFYEPDGTAAVGIVVTLRLKTIVYDEDGHVLTIPNIIETTDEDGAISADLIVGAEYDVSAPGLTRFNVVIPEGSGTLTLEGLHASGETATPVTDAHQIAIQAALVDYVLSATAAATYATLAGLNTEITNRTNTDTTLQADINTRLTQAAADARYALLASLTAHLADVANPHNVTAAQVGALTQAAADVRYALLAALDTHIANVANPHAVTAAQLGALTTSAAATTYGQLLAMWGPRYNVGAWFHASSLITGATTLGLQPGWLFLMPMLVSRTVTLDRVRIEVTTAGSADVVARIGIYGEDTATGKPGALIATLATISNPGVGLHDATISQALTPGWYYIGLLATGTTMPTVRASGAPVGAVLGASSMVPSNVIGTLIQTGLAALPSTAPVTNSFATTAPQIDYRVGAIT